VTTLKRYLSVSSCPYLDVVSLILLLYQSRIIPSRSFSDLGRAELRQRKPEKGSYSADGSEELINLMKFSDSVYEHLHLLG